jgi:O-acetylhomoserine/O-acetylserine sulfhydrylase-like pyridoxal-dependent enzyme
MVPSPDWVRTMPRSRIKPTTDRSALAVARRLSPRRKTSTARGIDALIDEQLAHFAIAPDTDIGRSLRALAGHVYHGQVALDQLWEATVNELARLDRRDRIACFNAQKFLCFQLAKLLDTLQHPFRKTYQSLVDDQTARLAKGPYPIFDNVTAIFSANPVITRTATYLYACTEWIDDAFQGKEMLLEVYSRLLNPTSTALANHIVDLECGTLATEYMAWNFNSGMAAIDATLAHVLGYRDIVIASRNVYGGTFQLLQDWYGKSSNLDVAVHWFDGYDARAFERALNQVQKRHADRLKSGRQIYVYLESPSNPHGYVLDVPAICAAAHRRGYTVIIDTTVATPYLYRPLMRDDAAERPDFVIHSYTKDITGTGTAIAGAVIGRNERMFIPKNESVQARDPLGKLKTYSWQDTLFWNVYYVKGAFLDSDKAFEVINGSRTLELRMLRKAVNTTVFASVLASHPDIRVHCNALATDINAALREKLMHLGLPAPLFTFDMEQAGIDRATFTRFFDCLEPAFGHMVSLGQSNTLILCPALTSHSEMSAEKLAQAGITPTTVRVAVGDEDPRTLIAHLIKSAELMLDPARPKFSRGFMSPRKIDSLFERTHLAVHKRWLANQMRASTSWASRRSR